MGVLTEWLWGIDPLQGSLFSYILVIHILSTFGNPYGLLCNHFFHPHPLKYPENASGNLFIYFLYVLLTIYCLNVLSGYILFLKSVN